MNHPGIITLHDVFLKPASTGEAQLQGALEPLAPFLAAVV